MTLVPQAPRDRIAWLDALRGFALIGILVANLPALSGYVFMSPEARAALSFDGGAGVLYALSAVLVEAKFYSIFSFLFGIGLAMQLGVDAGPLRRRLFVLLIIGLAHAWLVWWGDILCLYALLGLVVVALRPSPTGALKLGVAMLAAPVPIYALYLALDLGDPLAPAAGSPLGGFSSVLAAFAGGSPFDVIESNVTMTAGVVARRVLRFQVWRVLGMFLLGYWFLSALRNEPAEVMRARLLRWLRLGFGVGLPLNIVYWWLGGGDHLFPVQVSTLVSVAASSLGIPLLALGYASVFALYWRGDATASWLVAAGRMPLTNYLMQSVLGVLLFYGFAGDLWGELGRMQLLLLALVIALLQMAASHGWLQRHDSGPAEAAWRWLATRRSVQPVLER
jgi:uncharacterized protein